jgi:hypothetical protein
MHALHILFLLCEFWAKTSLFLYAAEAQKKKAEAFAEPEDW